MKIAITADVHLSSSHGERMKNFISMVSALRSMNVSHVIAAGDLFDSSRDGVVEFDNFANGLTDMSFTVVPGNHDQGIRAGMFGSKNINIIERPGLKRIGGGMFLFLPYRDGEPMGSELERSGLVEKLSGEKWALVSHGDFGRINMDENGNESGYFPLTRSDITGFRPAVAILGHIHRPGSVMRNVVYPGSPYPLDINETGVRKIIVLDSGTLEYSWMPVKSSSVYYKWDIFIIPDSHEKEQVREQLESLIKEAEVELNDNIGLEKVAVRITISGYTTERKGIEDCVRSILAEKGIEAEGLFMDSLNVIQGSDLILMASAVKERVDGLQLDYEKSEELKDEILDRAYEMLFGK